MMDLASELWASEFVRFLALVLIQCSLVTTTALLMGSVLRRAAALRQTVLRTGMVITLICPVVTLGLQLGDVSFISIPIPAKEAIVGQESVFTTAPSRRMALPSVAAGPEPAIAGHREVNNSGQAGLAVSAKGVNPIWRGTSSLLLLIWALGVLASGYGILRSWLKVHRLIGNARPLPGGSVLAAIERTQIELAIHRFPRVVCSKAIQTPVVVGVFRPVVILPEGLCERMSGTEMRMMLLHEMAHASQYDHVGLLLERMFVGIYWFHPLAHSLVRRLARAHEEVCDNYVLQSVDGPSYSEMLLKVARLLQHPSPISAGVGLFSLRWSLEERVSGLLDERRKTMVRTGILSRAVVAVFLSLIISAIGGTKLTAEQESSNGSSASSGSPARKSNLGLPKQAAPTLAADGKQSDLQLIQQECERCGVEVTEKEVWDEISRTAKRMRMSVDELLVMLRDKRGLAPEEYTNRIMWPKVALRKLAERRVFATAEEIAEGFEADYGPRVQVRLIVCRDKRHAEDVHARVTADPSTFARIARGESINETSAAAGGLVPPITHHRGYPEVRRAAFALAPGAISDIVVTNGRHYILHCERHISRKISTMTPEIRDTLRRTIEEKKVREMATEVMKQIRNNEKAGDQVLREESGTTDVASSDGVSRWPGRGD